MHYFTVATLFFLSTLISAKSGSLYARYADAEADAYTERYERALYSRNAKASPHANDGNELDIHIKRAIEARYANADAFPEAEAFPYAEIEISLEDLYRRAAYAYPEGFPEPAVALPEVCAARARRAHESYKSAEIIFWKEKNKFNPKKKSQKQAQLIRDTAALVAKGRRAATKALKDGGCPTDRAHDFETSTWEQRERSWDTLMKGCPRGS